MLISKILTLPKYLQTSSFVASIDAGSIFLLKNFNIRYLQVF